ncbi:hypothetical protein VKT23_011808 [Stygiomarasmius scandens]|uniref:Uncharacterized protein n=1 Tax=Marasmiellus scandens TaxID=2682957 RepID=A0ABR1JBF7_9AGAR
MCSQFYLTSRVETYQLFRLCFLATLAITLHESCLTQCLKTLLKEKGNEQFRNGRVAEAAALYRKAESAAPEDPVYPSKLSAALYELGDYLACFQAICQAVRKAQASQEDHSSLFFKLSGRLAKSLSHGSRNGTIKALPLEDVQAVISELKVLSESGNPGSELAVL